MNASSIADSSAKSGYPAAVPPPPLPATPPAAPKAPPISQTVPVPPPPPVRSTLPPVRTALPPSRSTSPPSRTTSPMIRGAEPNYPRSGSPDSAQPSISPQPSNAVHLDAHAAPHVDPRQPTGNPGNLNRSANDPTSLNGGVGAAGPLRWAGELVCVGENVSVGRRKPGGGGPPRSSTPTQRSGDNSGGDETDDEPVGLAAWAFRGGWIEEAPSWLISTVLHLIVLIVLALITLPSPEGLGKLVFEMSGEVAPVADLETFEIDDAVPEPFEFEEIVEEDIVTEVEVVEPPELPPMETIVEQVQETVVTDPSELGDAVQAAASSVVPPMFNGRTGALKEILLKTYGGTEKTQQAVALGLEWLKRNQKSDGGWSLAGPFDDGTNMDCRPAATAMAILAFAGDGNTHRGGPYQTEVMKGVRWLVKQNKKGNFVGKAGSSHQRSYAQAQVTIALAELYSMTGDSWLRPHVESAIQYAVDAQSDQGGWRYEPRYGGSDTSVTGWYVMALQSARGRDIEVPGNVLMDVGYYLDKVEHYDGAAYGYMPGRGPSPAMTAEGLLCRQYLGWGRNHKAMELGTWNLVKQFPFDPEDKDVYYWYYATQVLHHYGGSTWKLWNDVMKEELPAMQVKRGRERGSWSPQGDAYGSSAGRLYQTCLSIYCLEVYYRHMPLYKDQMDD